MKRYTQNLKLPIEKGFSLVDVMVGMVLSMLGIIVIFQVFSVSESIKRTTTSGGDAQQSGAAALMTLERAIKGAGYGLSSNDPVNVRIPVQLTINAAAVPDSIAVTSRAGWDFGPFTPDATAFPNAIPPVPSTEIFSINNQAQLVSNINGVIADGIVQLKTQYGTDANANGAIESNEWVTNVPANFMQVLAVRLAVVVRSAQPEIASTGSKDPTACDVSSANSVSLNWIASAAIPIDLTGQIGLAVGDNWRCYRYRTFQVTVPLRNTLWSA